ncbi:inactive shikimate kinase-like protein, partial [Trifolium medium]|nr:inactive shikimate kinase-like protein [Trifolium medium]
MAATTPAALYFLPPNTTTTKTINFFSILKPNVVSLRSFSHSSSLSSLSHRYPFSLPPCKCSFTAPASTTTYEFNGKSLASRYRSPHTLQNRKEGPGNLEFDRE